MRRAAWATAAVLVTAAIPVGLASAAAGELDPTFSGDGWVRTWDFYRYTRPYFAKGANDLALQPDGKIVAVGEMDDHDGLVLGAVRWTSSGDLDRSFGEDGWAATHIGRAPSANAVALQPDGKVVVCGEIDYDFAGITRFTADGSLDRSFGTGGVIRDPSGFAHRINDVAVQRDGKIVTVGTNVSYRDRNPAIAVSRYLQNGTLDPSFSRDGRVSISFGRGHENGYALALQRDGRIVVAGSVDGYDVDFAFARLRPNGRLDRTFSGDGRQTVRFGRDLINRVRALALQRNGGIVAVGESRVLPRYEPSRIALVRLKANGRLDRRFGKRRTNPGRYGGYGLALALQPDGRILVAGLSYEDADYSGSSWALLRYLPNGRLDSSFGRGGIVVTDFGTGIDGAAAIALQPDGRILVGGTVYMDLALARYRAR